MESYGYGLGGVPLPREPEDPINKELQAKADRMTYLLQVANNPGLRLSPAERAVVNANLEKERMSRVLPGGPPPPSAPSPVPPSTTAPSVGAGSWGGLAPSVNLEPPAMPGVSYGPVAEPEERAPIRAEMVNGKLVFTNRPSLGGQEVDYDKGVNQWQDRALLDQKIRADEGAKASGGYDGPALKRPEDERFRDFTIQRTPERAPGGQTGFRGSYIPSAPVPDVAGLDQKGFEQKQAELMQTGSPGAQDEFKRRYLEQEGIRQEVARRSVAEGQAAQAQGAGAQAQAAAGVDVARTAILQDPVANAVRQGTATAEQMKAFQSTLMQEAGAQVEAELAAKPGKATMIADTIMKAGLAKTPAEALCGEAEVGPGAVQPDHRPGPGDEEGAGPGGDVHGRRRGGHRTGRVGDPDWIPTSWRYGESWGSMFP